MTPLICIENVATGETETREMNETEYIDYLARTQINEKTEPESDPEPTPEEETPEE